MRFYNDLDIEMAQRRYYGDPVLGKAASLLAQVAADADNNSDGWHSWPKPCRACQQLITLIASGSATEAQFRKALAPIKAFYTNMAKSGVNYPAMPQVQA